VVLNALRLTRFTPPSLRGRVLHSSEKKKTKQKEEAEMFGFGKKESAVIAVEGMMCAHCAAHVEKALLAVKGVKSAKVDLTAANVTVTFTGTDVAALQAAITAAGYRVK
jgi:copper chaperone CopZ